jgi:DNA polymerase-1
LTTSTQASVSDLAELFDVEPEESFSSRTSRLNGHLRYLYEHPGNLISVDTETEGLRPDDGRDRAIGVSVAYRDDDGVMQSFYVAYHHAVGTNDAEKVRARLEYVLAQQPRTIAWANVKFDWAALLTIGIDVRHQPFYDIMCMAQMINENWPTKKSLDNLALEYLHGTARKVAAWPWEAKFKLASEKKTGWPNTTPFMMDEYARVDTELTLRVAEAMLKDRRWRDLPEHIWKHKQEFCRLLFVMSRRGLLIDQPYTRKWLNEGVARMREINDMLGLDLNKPGDIKHLFLERLGLPVVKRNKPTERTPEGSPSFDRFAMEIYEPMLERDGRPEAKLFTEYQGWKTAVGLLYRAWLEKVSPDGRLRTDFVMHETVTGRLSSRNPNLQQVPRESNKYWNGRAKEAFLAEEGWTLVNADFSQLELRVATGYSKEPAAMETFNAGEDIFNRMTAELRTTLKSNARNAQQATLAEKWDRNMTKVLVYRLQYGGGYKSLMNAYGIEEDLARDLLNNYRESFPRFQQLNRAITLKAEVEGQVKTWSGRVRHMQYESDAYKAMNSVIQGGSADIVERVMLRLYREIDDEDRCRILLTVHDSVVFEIRDELVDEYMPRIEAIMSDVDAVTAPESFGVKFAVEVERWHYSE